MNKPNQTKPTKPIHWSEQNGRSHDASTNLHFGLFGIQAWLLVRECRFPLPDALRERALRRVRIAVQLRLFPIFLQNPE